jgi:hypothetical protein
VFLAKPGAAQPARAPTMISDKIDFRIFLAPFCGIRAGLPAA